MSYILNALRKSEQERQAHTPILQSSIYQERTVEKRRGIWLIVALIAINLITLIFFIRLSSTDSNVGQQENPAQRVIPATAMKPGHSQPMHSALQEHPVILPSQSARLRRPVTNKHDFSISDVVDARRLRPSTAARKTGPDSQKGNPAGRPGPLSRPLHAASTASGNAQKLAHKAPLNSSGSTHVEPLKSITAKPPQRRQVTQPGSSKKAIASKGSQDTGARIRARQQQNKAMANAGSTKAIRQRPPVKTAKEVKKPSIPLLSELPLEFRRQVPKLNINVFVYADEPQQRFVIVDMVKYRTGENIQQKIQLKEILRDSLVVEYMGKIFRIMRP